jgi:hypothetical protein
MTDTAKRRNYTITKFSMHKDGYLHCRITFEGTAYYCTEKAGSWMIPDGAGYKEVLSPYREELAAKGRQFRKYLAKKKLDEKLQKAATEARASIAMGYKQPDIEKALMNRFKLTKEEAHDIIVGQLNTTKESDNGTTEK